MDYKNSSKLQSGYQNPVYRNQDSITDVSQVDSAMLKIHTQVVDALREEGIELEALLGAGNFGEVWSATHKGVADTDNFSQINRRL